MDRDNIIQVKKFKVSQKTGKPVKKKRLYKEEGKK